MIGSEGVAAVVDPQRDVEIYLNTAAEQGLEIRHIIETHLHADFVSGHRELAMRTGASIYLGVGSGAKFPNVPVQDGYEIRIGRCRLQFLGTPGHTMESVCVLVTDLDRSAVPFAVLTGDTLFIGDVGRPDLSPDKTPQQLASLLYDSLHNKLLTLPDAVQVYPAHGAGSLCGRQISSESASTIGKEKAGNYALQAMTREEFVRLTTSELPDRPGYFEQDAEINRAGAPPIAELPPLQALRPLDLYFAQQNGALILDTRPADQFAAAHVPGSIQIGLSGQFAIWAGRLLGLEQELVLVAEDPATVNETRTRLTRVGIDRAIGYLADGLAGWVRDGLPVGSVPQISVQELHRLLEEDASAIRVIDVRRPAERKAGYIAQSLAMPLDQLMSLAEGMDRESLVAVHCKSGYRSSMAASLLLRAGFKQVVNVVGGMDAWQVCNFPSVTGK